MLAAPAPPTTLTPPENIHAVAVVGSREWGEAVDRQGNPRPEAIVEHELAVSAKVVGRLVERWVLGEVEPMRRRIPSAQAAEPGPGLLIVSGAARGADTHAENLARMFGEGLRRRSRSEFGGFWSDVAEVLGEAMAVGGMLAQGLYLEVYPADWDGLGKAAGPARNEVMSQRVHEVIALYAFGQRVMPGFGRGGTNDMVRRCQLKGLGVHAYDGTRRAWLTLGIDGARG
jgi:hypothetical protein